MPLDEAVLRALQHVEEDSTLALVLPVVLAKNAERVSFAELEAKARARHLEARLGMLLDVTAEVTPLHSARSAAANLYEFRNTTPVFLPPPKTRLDEQLARQRTPEIMRRWGFLMNVREDSLREFARKHLGA